MGTLTYDSISIEFDDRTLTHLHVVIMQKFRRGESFPMSWVDDVQIGDGRGALWMTPTTPIFFKFDGSRVPAIDQAWIDRLHLSADSPRGLVVTDGDGNLVRASGLQTRIPSPSNAVVARDAYVR